MKNKWHTHCTCELEFTTLYSSIGLLRKLNASFTLTEEVKMASLENDKFRDKFKYYKQRTTPIDMDNVIDFYETKNKCVSIIFCR